MYHRHHRLNYYNRLSSWQLWGDRTNDIRYQFAISARDCGDRSASPTSLVYLIRTLFINISPLNILLESEIIFVTANCDRDTTRVIGAIVDITFHGIGGKHCLDNIKYIKKELSSLVQSIESHKRTYRLMVND